MGSEAREALGEGGSSRCARPRNVLMLVHLHPSHAAHGTQSEYGCNRPEMGSVSIVETERGVVVCPDGEALVSFDNAIWGYPGDASCAGDVARCATGWGFSTTAGLCHPLPTLGHPPPVVHQRRTRRVLGQGGVHAGA